jgi:hypothetical protein
MKNAGWPNGFTGRAALGTNGNGGVGKQGIIHHLRPGILSNSQVPLRFLRSLSTFGLAQAILQFSGHIVISNR